ncbi:MAG: flagellar motor protein MotB [Desulfomonilia bacterium]
MESSQQLKMWQVHTNINFWPSFVDVVATILILFVFINITLMSLVGDPEALKVRLAREELKQALERRFLNEHGGNTVSFASSPNLLQIRFSSEVLFDTGEYRLKERGKKLLAACTQILLKKNAPPFDQIQVEGHTDDVRLNAEEYPSDNWELSTARALEVLKYLRGLGIPSRKLSANGYAEFRPIKRGSSTKDRKLNRRVELRIVFSTPEG